MGSSCNACDEKEEIRATLSVMDADGKNQHIITRGLRNAVGMRFVAGTLYLTNMGADHLGENEPDDPMFTLNESTLRAGIALDFGWPHCRYSAGKTAADVKFPARDSQAGCEKSPHAFAHFAAHSSPLGLDYFGENFSEPSLQKHFLVALYGPSNTKLDRGYRVDERGEVQDFITGFANGGVVKGRPCDIFKMDERSFMLSDDNAGVVYYVRAK